MKIAIIGGGAAGIVTAYLLHQQHEVTIYEKQAFLGGNVRTLGKNVPAAIGEPEVVIDNGVIEFQKDHFAYFHKLMDRLGIEMQEIEGGSSALYFNDGSHILGPGLVSGNESTKSKLVAYRKLIPILASHAQFLCKTRSLDQVKHQPMSKFWSDHKWHLWQRLLLMYGFSIPSSQLGDFPAELGVEIIRNSGYGTRWTRVVGGVYGYFEKILAEFSGELVLNSQLSSIQRTETGIKCSLARGEAVDYDKVVFACPPDQTLPLLADPSEAEVRCFENWQGSQAQTVIHTDVSLYKRYGETNISEFDVFEKQGTQNGGYNAYLNRLIGLPDAKGPHYCLAYNLLDRIDENAIIDTQQHHTPLYTVDSLKHRDEVVLTNGQNHTYHAGAYLGNGLHEGAIVSALQVSKLLGGETL